MSECKYHDPHCPCQDGDACHYEDCGDTKAWDPRYVLAAHIDKLTARLAEAEARLRELRATIEWAHHGMEIARIWGGMDWHWNHLAAFRAKAIWERLDTALAESAEP